MVFHHSIKGSVVQRTYILKYFKISWYSSLRVYKDYVKRIQYSSSRGNFIVSLEYLVQQLSSTYYEVISADYFKLSTIKRVNITEYSRFGKLMVQNISQKVNIVKYIQYRVQCILYRKVHIVYIILFQYSKKIIVH